MGPREPTYLYILRCAMLCHPGADSSKAGERRGVRNDSKPDETKRGRHLQMGAMYANFPMGSLVVVPLVTQREKKAQAGIANERVSVTQFNT